MTESEVRWRKSKKQELRTSLLFLLLIKHPFLLTKLFSHSGICNSAVLPFLLKLACCSPFSFHQNNRFLVDLSPNTHCCFPFFHFPSLRLSLLPESLLLIFVLGITEFQNPKLSQSLHSVTLFSFLSTISSSLLVITLLFHFPAFCFSSPLLSSLPERKKNNPALFHKLCSLKAEFILFYYIIFCLTIFNINIFVNFLSILNSLYFHERNN